GHPCLLEMAAMFAQVSFRNYAYELVIAENWKTPETTRVHQLCCVAQQITRCRCNGWFGHPITNQHESLLNLSGSRPRAKN
ncbi:MAG TPA: hypothetical protein VK355_12265, partial [Candidatus Binatia bacterium]|nr:hypothetical protein [Candidatus Binatia bacterium]